EKHDDQALRRARVNSDAARSGVISLRTQVSAQRTEIIDLRVADRRFQTTVRTQQEEIREDEREEIPEADMPLRKRLYTAHTGTYELGESSAAATARLREPVRDDLYRFVDTVDQGEGSTPAAIEVGYGITDTWDDLEEAIQETAPTTIEGVNQRVTKLSTTFDQETSMIYAMI
nr:hypothetical protein [Tanacetum cinerariifolium]